ncbi:hypothetical protein ACWENO_14000 [Streptomyces sp. NPDC004436]
MTAAVQPPRRHLRDAATICPDVSGWGRLTIRCEREAGHDGKHKNGCAHWGRTEGGAS